MTQANNLYAFDADSFEVAFNARPTSENPAIVYHRLRKPGLAELIEREGQINYWRVEISHREDEIRIDDETANARLWDKIVLAVKGYSRDGDWRELTAEEKAAMKHGHKVTAIRALYSGSCQIEGDEECVSIG